MILVIDIFVRPTYNLLRAADIQKAYMVELAQLVRALVCGTRGHGFDSHIPPQFFLHSGEIPGPFELQAYDGV